jgi:predicted lipoprotein with Yx(FWY)xxD motif
MKSTRVSFSNPLARALAVVGLGLASSLVLAACGGASPATSPSPTKASSSPSSTPALTVTIRATTVAGLGTVLVNAQGRTLYTLSSESSGKLTCTVSNGCSQSWTEVDLPSGASAATAADNAKSSLLATETGATGTLVTYNGWPLYTFVGDSKATQANGEGLQSFGGTWYVLSTSGAPVHPASAHASPTSSSSGYSY